MAMPSVTVMVQNSRGVVPARGDADERLVDLRRRQTHRVIVRAMRRALRALGHMAAGELGLELGTSVHNKSCDVVAASDAPAPSAAVSPHGIIACGLKMPSRPLLDPAEKSGKVTTAWNGLWFHQRVWPNRGVVQ
jgi:hypothetical protein